MRFILMIMITSAGLCTLPALGQDAGSGQQTIDLMRAAGPTAQQGQNSQTHYGAGTGTRNGSPVQFERFEKVPDEKKTTIREDAAVLNHMIAKELPLKKSRAALGVQYSYAFGNNKVVYDDHGLKLVYHVPIQLIPSESSDTGSNKSEEPKSEWQKAKDEMHGTTGIRSRTGTVGAGGVTGNWNFRLAAPGLDYDEEYVDRITRQIRSALANAGNIRDLSDDDMVSVFVYGSGTNVATRSVKIWRVRWDVLSPGKPKDSVVEETTYLEKINLSSGEYSSFGVSGRSGSR